MSPKLPVNQLNYLCLKFISNQIIHALSDDEGVYYDSVQVYLQGATYEILQDLLKIILSAVNLDAGTRFSCLQLLLRPDMKQLTTGIFPQYYWKNILEVIAVQGKNLSHLNLKGVWVRDYPAMLCQVIKNLENLNTLIIPHMADDSVLAAVSNLKQIAVLDICGEACFTVEGIKSLRTETLQVLDIGNFGKVNICEEEPSGSELVAYLIENNPNLKYLKTYSFTGDALKVIYKKHLQFRSRIKYLHDTGTDFESGEAIVQLCPDLTSVHINGAKKDILQAFSKLKKIHSLKLTKCDVSDIIDYLSVSGCDVQELKINSCKSAAVNLSEIATLCPNLATFESFRTRLIFPDQNIYFVNLLNVELLYCECNVEVIRALLVNSPFLKRFVVGCVINMTDGDIFRLCAECDFSNLEELWLSYAKGLTVISVELLMSHCQKLRLIGQLSGWDVQQEELDYLNAVIASKNIDLTLRT